MFFVSTQLSLPLFLVTRTRYKHHRPEAIRKYINKRRRFYIKNCNEGNVNPTATHKKLKKLTGYHEPSSEKTCRQSARAINYKRELTTVKPWELPPNMYNEKSRPFIERKGISGALWQKVHRHRSLLRKPLKSKWAFYDIEPGTERLLHTSNRHKGIFLSNARDRRPTARCMISDGSVRYYAKPRGTMYFPKLHQINYNITPKDTKKLPLSHKFYPGSCVPVRDVPSATVKPNISFAPGPGRYEIRFPKTCPCSHKIYNPYIQYDIERAKRQKFRRLPYKAINSQRYCTPEFRHVEGQGHRRLFKIAQKRNAEKTFPKLGHEKHLQLYATGQYINIITNPNRVPISRWAEGDYKVLDPPVRFNCMAKRIVRKHLRYNRKIAFDSGADRFKDMERQPSLTPSQIETIKMSLPIERRLRDQPVMRIEPDSVRSKLLFKPKHQTPPAGLDLRKRLFKFPTLPQPKVLVSERDIRGKSIDGQCVSEPYFGRELTVLEYFKNDITRDIFMKSGGFLRKTSQKRELFFNIK